MSVFILAESSIGGSDPDIRGEQEFMPHVPCIAMRDHNQRLAQALDLSERIQLSFDECGRLSSLGKLRECVDINAAREVFALPKKDGRSQRLS
jgi:hypothetical protein